MVGSDDKAKEAVCYANELKKDFENLYTSMVETGDAKWIYYGSQDGVLINYPGFLWPRCGGRRRRLDPGGIESTPWFQIFKPDERENLLFALST